MKKLIIFFLIGLIIFNLSNRVLAEEVNNLQFVSLKIQKFFNDLGETIFASFLKKEDDQYKEKYFSLLQELAELKLNLKTAEENLKELSSLNNLQKLNFLKKDNVGYYYFENLEKAEEGDLVVDRKLTLIGFVLKKTKNYLIVKSLLFPDLEFNLADAEGEFLGSGKTVGNGFLEINYPQAKKIEKNQPVFTFGNDNLFPANFLVGTVYEIKKTNNSERVIVKLEGAFEEKEFYLYK